MYAGRVYAGDKELSMHAPILAYFGYGYKNIRANVLQSHHLVGQMQYLRPPLFLFEHIQICRKPQPNFRPNRSVFCSDAILKKVEVKDSGARHYRESVH